MSIYTPNFTQTFVAGRSKEPVLVKIQALTYPMSTWSQTDSQTVGRRRLCQVRGQVAIREFETRNGGRL